MALGLRLFVRLTLRLGARGRPAAGALLGIHLDSRSQSQDQLAETRI